MVALAQRCAVMCGDNERLMKAVLKRVVDNEDGLESTGGSRNCVVHFMRVLHVASFAFLMQIIVLTYSNTGHSPVHPRSPLHQQAVASLP